MRARLLAVLTLGALLQLEGIAYAGDVDSSWFGTRVSEESQQTDVDAVVETSSADLDYSLEPVCQDGFQYVCRELEPCVQEGETGVRYHVLYQDQDTGATYCQREQTAGPPQVTPGMVLAAFKRYDWPASRLQVQPPNGRTAVNFDTYFFTEDDDAVVREFSLLGRTIEVEATPSVFTWVWGDGEQRATATPGGPYPQGDVVHQYLRKGEVAPRLDTTYGGRYRVDGGPWVGLPGTLTVAGEPQALDVVEIRPTLVASGPGAGDGDLSPDVYQGR